MEKSSFRLPAPFDGRPMAPVNSALKDAMAENLGWWVRTLTEGRG
jgi:hypothetical protein